MEGFDRETFFSFEELSSGDSKMGTYDWEKALAFDGITLGLYTTVYVTMNGKFLSLHGEKYHLVVVTYYEYGKFIVARRTSDYFYEERSFTMELDDLPEEWLGEVIKFLR